MPPKWRPRTIKVTLALCCVFAIGCSPKAQQRSSPMAPTPFRPVAVQVGKYGVGCRTFQAPLIVGPPSYLVRDVGKNGVPALDRRQVRVIRAIQRYVHSKTLRFAIFTHGIAPFVVFDAPDGPCSEASYWVLNDRFGNLYYEPGEAPGFLHAEPSDAAPTPGPWMQKNAHCNDIAHQMRARQTLQRRRPFERLDQVSCLRKAHIS